VKIFKIVAYLHVLSKIEVLVIIIKINWIFLRVPMIFA